MIGGEKIKFWVNLLIPKLYKINYDCFILYKIFNIKIYNESNYNSIELYYISFL